MRTDMETMRTIGRESGHGEVRQLPSHPVPGDRGFDAFRKGMLETDEGFTFFRNPLVLSVVSASALLLVGAFLSVFFFIYRGAREVIILHYNVYFGIDIIGSPWQAFVVPGAPLIFFLLNLFLAWRFYGVRERVVSHILLFSAFFAALAGAVVSAALSFVNS